MFRPTGFTFLRLDLAETLLATTGSMTRILPGICWMSPVMESVWPFSRSPSSIRYAISVYQMSIFVARIKCWPRFREKDQYGLFFTIWYGVFNRRDRMLRYASEHPMMRHILPVSRREKSIWNDATISPVLPRYDLERIHVPTLLISAEDDLCGTYPSARYTAAHIPGARFVGYPTGGHLLLIQRALDPLVHNCLRAVGMPIIPRRNNVSAVLQSSHSTRVAWKNLVSNHQPQIPSVHSSS